MIRLELTSRKLPKMSSDVTYYWSKTFPVIPIKKVDGVTYLRVRDEENGHFWKEYPIDTAKYCWPMYAGVGKRLYDNEEYHPPVIEGETQKISIELHPDIALKDESLIIDEDGYAHISQLSKAFGITNDAVRAMVYSDNVTWKKREEKWMTSRDSRIFIEVESFVDYREFLADNHAHSVYLKRRTSEETIGYVSVRAAAKELGLTTDIVKYHMHRSHFSSKQLSFPSKKGKFRPYSLIHLEEARKYFETDYIPGNKCNKSY